MIRAAVYVPPEISGVERFATEGFEFAEHRGYAYAGTYTQPHYIDKLLAEGIVSVVIFARSTHRHPDCRWPAEFVDETTRPIQWAPRLPPSVRERNGTLNWSRARVREVLDSNEPIPRGLDPESIAAARRIARHLANCRNQ